VDNQFDQKSNQEVDVIGGGGLADVREKSSDSSSAGRTTGRGSARYESSERHYQEELSLKSITQILVQNWALFVVIFFSLLTISSVFYKFKVPFQSVGSIIINDSKNSVLQSFTSQYSGQNLNLKTNEAKKANSSVLKQIEYLSTADFLLKLAEHLSENTDLSKMNSHELKGRDLFKKDILGQKTVDGLSSDEKIQVVQKIDALLKISLKSDYEAIVTMKSLDRFLTYYVSKNSVQYISDQLKDSEKLELSKIKEFLTLQKSGLDESIQNLNKQLSDFQSQPQNLISLSSDKVGDYISDLMMRKNEVRMKISENNQMINSLSQSSNGRRDSALYGISGKIAALKLENQALSSRMSDLQQSIDRMISQAKSIPTANITFEELKKKIDIEFEKYKQVSLDLSKIEASDLSSSHKFNILELPRFDKVVPSVSYVTLFLVCLILSQFMGAVIIYIRSIWHTKYVTAEETRNIVVIDGHSLDPRVIIENSKIRFSLQNSQFKNEDSTNEGPKKLDFKISSKKTVNGLTMNSDESDK
jgi:hypothetical protein